MSDSAQDLPKKKLPERIHRDLRTGETIFHSTLPCHVSNKFPEGKWIGQVRRDVRGKLVKYPVKGFGTPKEALDYVKSLRPDEKGNVAAPQQGEATVRDLYKFVTEQRQKRMAESTKNNKAMRWRIYIEPEWGDYPVSQVTRRAAQDWITEVEGQIANGELGTFGLPHFQKVRSDLHTLFESMATFSSTYEDRNNPFAGLDFTPPPPRAKVTMESQFFGGLAAACRHFVAEELCTGWIAEMFLTSLFAGLREGEVMALCRDQLDFKNGAIVIDRALRRDSRAIDPKTRLEFGAVVPQAMNLPKGGSPTRNKTRVVPMSDQLAEILEKVFERRGALNSEWDLLWPSQKGDMRALGRFRHAWGTLRARLHEVAIYAPLVHEGGKWPEVSKRQGWPRNSYIDVARADAQRRLPDIFANIDFRDTRNSFASYMNELDLSQATREHILGHGGGLTNTVYTVITSAAHQNARQRITNGWAGVVNDSISKQAVVVVP